MSLEAVLPPTVLGSQPDPGALPVAATALTNGGYAVAWDEVVSDGTATVQVRIVDATGSVTAVHALADPEHYGGPGHTPKLVGLSTGEFVVAWRGDYGSYSVIGPDGTLIASDRVGENRPYLAAGADGAWVMVWTGQQRGAAVFTAATDPAPDIAQHRSYGTLAALPGGSAADTEVVALRGGGYVTLMQETVDTHTLLLIGPDASLTAGAQMAIGGPTTPQRINVFKDLEALSQGGFVLTRGVDGQLETTVYDASGQQRPGSDRVMLGPISGVPQAAATADGGYVVFWSNGSELLSAAFDAENQLRSGPVHTGINFGGFGNASTGQVAWTGSVQAAELSNGEIAVLIPGMTLLFDASGHELARYDLPDYSPSGHYPSHHIVALADGAFAITYQGDGKVYHAVLQSISGPTAVLADHAPSSIAEGTVGGRLAVAILQVTDDGAGTNVLSLSGDDAALFELDGTTLFLKAGAIVDFETNPLLDVSVYAADERAPAAAVSANIQIAVTDVDTAETLSGTARGDRIAAGLGQDRVFGFSGADTLRGGTDGDVVGGGRGNDRVLGEAGDDTLSGGTGDDLLAGGVGSDWMRGGDGRDLLGGGAGQDRLDGGAGSDTLTGGAGRDLLAGSAGADTFRFLAASDSIGGRDSLDVILDFQPGRDVIDLVGLHAEAGSVRMRYDTGGGETARNVLFIDRDHDGDVDASEFAVVLVTPLHLTVPVTGDVLLD